MYSTDVRVSHMSHMTRLPGSRERQKWVMEYDSYRFTSKRWSLLAHHFCKVIGLVACLVA